MSSKADFFDEITIKVEYQDDTLIIQCRNCYCTMVWKKGGGIQYKFSNKLSELLGQVSI